jgi:Spy/CpxP family protein refolding chaperone
MVAAVIVAIVACAVPAVAQVAQAGGQGGRAVMGRPIATFPAVPGYYSLRMEHVRDQLELIDEQKQKLQELGKEYSEKTRSQYSQQDWAKVREMSAEERRKHYAELNIRRQKLAEEIKAEIEKILLPHQLKQLKEIEFRTRAASMLYSPLVLDRVGVSEEQRETLGKIRTELQARMQKLRDESLEKMFDALTPEQRKKLEEEAAQGFRGYSPGQGGNARN